MNILDNFDIEVNFWKTYPTYKIIKTYKKLYDSDTSRGKEKSSKIMWAIALVCAADGENPIIRLPYEEKLDIVKGDYLNKTFNWDDYTEQINFFLYSELSQAKRSLLNLDRKLQEREKFINDTPYDLDNGAKLDTMLANTEKMHTLRERLVETINKEKEGGATKGGRIESASEQHIL